jgi:hypothetical protein
MSTVIGKVRVVSSNALQGIGHTALLERIDGAHFDRGDLLRDVQTGLLWEITTFNFATFTNPEHIRTRRSVQVRAVEHASKLPVGELQIVRPGSARPRP